MADDQSRSGDPLLAKAEEIERLRRFVDRTSFAGDEREVADELAAVDQHPADVADVTLQREDDYAAKVVLEHEAEEIQRALKRKQEGCYGICANCGRPIPKERLEARPEAIYCIDCQRLLEGRR
jgi:RNA polymerase-binding transcription factor DksA